MNLDWVALLLRWLHILAASAAIGGTLFMRLALAPAAESLADEPRKTLHEQVRARWSKVVMWAIVLLLVTGVWNFILINQQYNLNKAGPYHMLFGIKFLVALAVFFISSALVGRSKVFEKLRNQRKLWLTVNLVLVIVIVCISGTLRALKDNAKKPLPTRALPQAVERDVAHLP